MAGADDFKSAFLSRYGMGLIIDSVSYKSEETLWAKLPGYFAGDSFVRLIPFKDHINIEAHAVIQLSRIKYSNNAFVIISGYDDFSYCREALRLQITDYILKPVNYEEFGNCIDNLKISLFEQRVSALAEPEK